MPCSGVKRSKLLVCRKGPGTPCGITKLAFYWEPTGNERNFNNEDWWWRDICGIGIRWYNKCMVILWYDISGNSVVDPIVGYRSTSVYRRRGRRVEVRDNWPLGLVYNV